MAELLRVDDVSIEVIDNFTDKDKNLMEKPTYDFRGRINVSNGKNDAAMQKAVKYLIQYKEDGTPDADLVANTLASRITWELIDSGTGNVMKDNDNKEMRDSVICMAGTTAVSKDESGSETKTVIKESKVIGSYTKKRTKEYQKENGDTVKVAYEAVNIKPARIEQYTDGAEKGTWYIKQMPEIDISPQSNTETGLPENTELKVTIEMLHPRGVVTREDGGEVENTSRTPYKDNKVEASASIKGEQTIYTDKNIIIVEPGQGTKDTEASKVLIPIRVGGGAVYEMKATITGNTSGDTKPTRLERVGNATSLGVRTWNLEMAIGTDEKGVNGLIDVEVKAYGTGDKLLSTTTFQLAVRRVNKVTVNVENGKDINKENTEGNTITLEAYPSGFGADNGTEYFAIQTIKKDGAEEVCEWEKDYKSPYVMDWTMLYNSEEKPLAKWTEYFETGSIQQPAPKDEESKSTVTFKLKQALPYGAEIRATALHTTGGSYNKSGKEYGKQFGSLKINNLIDGGWRRGTDNPINTGFQVHRSDYEKQSQDTKQRGFFRYREIGGEWKCGYRALTDASEVPAKLDTADVWVLEPDKDYEVEVIIAVFSQDDKKLYWPHDESLLETGAGWKEAGFTKGWTGNDETDPSEYRRNYYVGKSYLIIDKGSNVGGKDIGLTVGDRYYKPYAESNPLKLKTGETLQVNLEQRYFHLGNYQSNFRPKLQKLEGDKWVDVTVNGSNTSDGWTLQTSCPNFQIYNIQDKHQGRYRVGIFIDNLDKWRRIDESQPAMDQLLAPQYKEFSLSTILHDWNTGDGVLYFDINMN